MSKKKTPVTPAVRVLRAAGVEFADHLYDYQERGGTAVSSQALGVEEHHVIKTLVFEDEEKRPLLVLMHGDLEVSAKSLARTMGVKSVSPCAPQVAERHTGYKVGGTSPFGTKRSLPVYAEASIRLLDRIFINGGARGYLVSLCPSALDQVCRPTWVQVAQSRQG